MYPKSFVCGFIRVSASLFFQIYVLLVMNFDWFMLPLILFLVLLKNYTVHMLSPTRKQEEVGTIFQFPTANEKLRKIMCT